MTKDEKKFLSIVSKILQLGDAAIREYKNSQIQEFLNILKKRDLAFKNLILADTVISKESGNSNSFQKENYNERLQIQNRHIAYVMENICLHLKKELGKSKNFQKFSQVYGKVSAAQDNFRKYG